MHTSIARKAISLASAEREGIKPKLVTSSSCHFAIGLANVGQPAIGAEGVFDLLEISEVPRHRRDAYPRASGSSRSIWPRPRR
jgi:hypothetical protein